MEEEIHLAGDVVGDVDLVEDEGEEAAAAVAAAMDDAVMADAVVLAVAVEVDVGIVEDHLVSSSNSQTATSPQSLQLFLM